MSYSINVEQLFDVRLLSIIENNLKNEIPVIIEFKDGTKEEIKDLDFFSNLLKKDIYFKEFDRFSSHYVQKEKWHSHIGYA